MEPHIVHQAVNWAQLAYTVLAFLVSMFFGTVTVVWNFRGSVDKFREDVLKMHNEMRNDIDGRILQLTKENDVKVGRVYERFDMHKHEVEEKYVQKELCQVMHNSTAQQLTETNVRLSNLERKIDRLVENIGANGGGSKA